MAASGDPQVLAAPVFVIGSISLGLQLTQYIPNGYLGAPLAVITGCTALYLIISTIWAASAGQSFVASFAGTFGAFWASYSILVFGVFHGWFGAGIVGPPANTLGRVVAVFSISFAAFFAVMTIVALRLPAIYPAIIGLVVLALCLVAAAFLDPNSAGAADPDILKVAGYVVLVFAGLGLSVSWTVLNLSLGGPVFPPLGPVIVKPKPAPTA